MASGDYPKVKEWRKANPGKVLEQARRYRAKHPETNQKAKRKYRIVHGDRIRPIEAFKMAQKRKSDPEGQRTRQARWRAKRELTLAQQAGRPRPEVCDICHEFNRAIVFDHCHSSGQFRGWLCDRCNKVLGIVRDSPELLMALRDYLKGAVHGQTQSENQKQTA